MARRGKKTPEPISPERAAEQVVASVRARRAISGATGTPETPPSPPEVLVETRLVQDPMMTDAEFQYQKRQEAERAERSGRKQNLNIGKTPAQVNLLEMIGGLARFKDCCEHQMMAAARLRTLYSLALIGDARAIDYTAVKVDGEPQRKTPLEIGDEARREYRRVMMALGMRLGSLVENVVLHDRPIRAIAVGYGYGESGAARRKLKDDLFHALDIAAEKMELRTRKKAA